jgi:hypothetical protein
VTVGHDIALGSSAGSGVERDLLLFHEMAHVAQQREAGSGPDTTLGADELAADQVTVATVLGARASPGRGGALALRRCDDPPPKVKQAASKTDPAKLSGFEKMVQGGVSAADAADKMQLPQELRDAMAEAWKNSFPGGTSKEQGGLLVRKSDGTLDFVKATKTTSGSTTLPWDQVPTGATPLVAAHTHPYDAKEGGYQGVMFSGGDLANLVTDEIKVKVVHAGDRYFAVSKSKEFEDHVAGLSPADRTTYAAKISAAWDKTFKASSGDTVSAAREATYGVCRKFDLVLYEGKLDGGLTKVDTSK